MEVRGIMESEEKGRKKSEVEIGGGKRNYDEVIEGGGGGKRS